MTIDDPWACPRQVGRPAPGSTLAPLPTALQQFLQQNGCCRGLYSPHALFQRPISSTASTALQRFYSIQPRPTRWLAPATAPASPPGGLLNAPTRRHGGHRATQAVAVVGVALPLRASLVRVRFRLPATLFLPRWSVGTEAPGVQLAVSVITPWVSTAPTSLSATSPSRLSYPRTAVWCVSRPLSRPPLLRLELRHANGLPAHAPAQRRTSRGCETSELPRNRQRRASRRSR